MKKKKTVQGKTKEFYKDDSSSQHKGMTHPKKWGADDVEKKEKKYPPKKGTKKW